MSRYLQRWKKQLIIYKYFWKLNYTRLLSSTRCNSIVEAAIIVLTRKVLSLSCQSDIMFVLTRVHLRS